MPQMTDHQEWWKRAVVYEVCVPTFQDSNGDGMGDLPGVRQRLDYLEWLGVDALWLTPFFPTNMTDFGYDIIDHAAVHAAAGTLDDFDRLVEDVHRRGMRLILDLVPNHTSDRHPWFRESASSRTSDKRRWYVWADAADGGGPPNNWQSDLGGSAWRWHPPTQQYFYTAFAEDQPDLNWREPAVRAAIERIMRFWFDRGVDGFRIDVLWHLAKDQLLRDNPPNPDYNPRKDSPCSALIPAFSADQPDVHGYVEELREIADDYTDRLLIGEVYLPLGELVRYYGVERSGVHLPFNFQLIQQPWNAIAVRRVVDEYEGSVGVDEWPNWVLGNHDQPRVATRIGRAQARVAAMLVLTLRGTPTLYNGDELGMVNGDVAREDMLDPRARSCDGRGIGRDPFRSPMQWDGSAHAGFTTGRPWLPMPRDPGPLQVAAQREDPASMLSLHRELLALRRRSPALHLGGYLPLDVDCEGVFAYTRFHADQAFLVALNLTDVARDFALPARIGAGAVELSTRDRSAAGRRITGRIQLAPDEGLLVRLDRPPSVPASTMRT
jgi:alpha-glucosidase